MKVKPLWFFETLYRQNYYFLRGAGPAELSAYVKKQFGLDASFDGNWEGKCAMISHPTEGTRFVCAVRKWNPRSLEALGALMHECNHAAMFTLLERGVDVSTENHEAFTYLAQRIFTEFLRGSGVRK